MKSMPRHGVRKPGRRGRLQPDSIAIWQMSECPAAFRGIRRRAGLPDIALRGMTGHGFHGFTAWAIF
ncbi:hypothetical protein IP88_09830 [alpha proteobacterium AAP81b]|nr:hypothetical protein IP88_09830 [alpha proteobacterium AAP81b]